MVSRWLAQVMCGFIRQGTLQVAGRRTERGGGHGSTSPVCTCRMQQHGSTHLAHPPESLCLVVSAEQAACHEQALQQGQKKRGRKASAHTVRASPKRQARQAGTGSQRDGVPAARCWLGGTEPLG